MKSTLQNDRYEIVSQIGTGGMATVYKVIDTKLKVTRAIKKIINQGTDGRARREAYIMVGLMHPNIVSVFDCFEEDDAFHIVMEHCQCSAVDWIAQNHPMNAKTAIKVTLDILSALEFVHQSGVIHRDIKPHNILISQNGKAKLTDFGLAQITYQDSTLTKTNTILGSLRFMSPEQRHGNLELSANSDLYSLAMTLIWLICQDIKGDLFSKEAIQKLQIDSRIPDSLVPVFQKAGMENPKRRYLSAADMTVDLKLIFEEIEAVVEPLLGAHSNEFPVHTAQDSAQDPLLNASLISQRQFQWTIAFLLVLFLIVLGGFSVVVYLMGNIQPPDSRPSLSGLDRCPNHIDTFSQKTSVGPRETSASTYKDIDGDGFEDAIFVNQLDENITVYWGNVEGKTNEQSTIEIGRSGVKPIVSDIDMDGIPELVTLHSDDSRIKIFKQTEDRTWTLGQEHFQSGFVKAAAIQDYDNDGFVDLLLAGYATQGIQELYFRAGSSEGFKNHTKVGNVNFGVFATHQPLIFTVEPDGVYQQRLSSNLILGQKEQLYSTTQQTDLFILEEDDRFVLYAYLEDTKELIQVTPDPCLLHNTPISSGIDDIGYWNDDQIIDLISSRTCAGCTSNHILWVGMN